MLMCFDMLCCVVLHCIRQGNQGPDGRVGWHNLTLLKLTGFVTVIFTVQIITRWWAVRVLLQGVFGKANSIVTTLAATLSVNAHKHSQEVSAEASLAQEQITRYLNLAHCLLYKVCVVDRDLQDLQRDDCATQEELDCLLQLQEFHPNDVYSWIAILIHRLGHAGLLGVSGVWLLHHITSIVSCIAFISSHVHSF
jgi:hypothetical protein